MTDNNKPNTPTPDRAGWILVYSGIAAMLMGALGSGCFGWLILLTGAGCAACIWLWDWIRSRL